VLLPPPWVEVVDGAPLGFGRDGLLGRYVRIMLWKGLS
jgi:hypothetical protein